MRVTSCAWVCRMEASTAECVIIAKGWLVEKVHKMLQEDFCRERWRLPKAMEYHRNKHANWDFLGVRDMLVQCIYSASYYFIKISIIRILSYHAAISATEHVSTKASHASRRSEHPLRKLPPLHGIGLVDWLKWWGWNGQNKIMR